MAELETRDLYDATAGLFPRDGGPYLDELEREEAEKRRARREGREPDLENPGPATGTQLVTYDRLSEGHASYPSQREVLDDPQRRNEQKPRVVQTVIADTPENRAALEEQAEKDRKTASQAQTKPQETKK